jgi:hypothetical protein
MKGRKVRKVNWRESTVVGKELVGASFCSVGK